MAEQIVPRSVISRQADRAAQVWLSTGHKPPNPYDEHLQPAHHRCWECDIERQRNELVPEAEGSA